ncbi:MAG: transposase [Patescibacteria group bacterium]
MQRKFSFSIGEFYHIYNRGTEKRKIFLNEKDYRRFIKLLFLSNGTKPVVIKDLPQGRSLGEVSKGNNLVSIGAYCLMPNHFHLLVREITENGITKFMSKLSTAYSMYFNKTNERTGSLFEGRFKALHVENDEYLKYLFSYIHLNPIKIIDKNWKSKTLINTKNIKEYLENYSYSSYLDYVGKDRAEKIILNKNSFPEYFESFKEFQKFVYWWLEFKSKDEPKDRPWG